MPALRSSSLRAQDFHRVLDHIHRLYDPSTPWDERVLDVVSQVVPGAVSVGFNTFHHRTERVDFQLNWRLQVPGHFRRPTRESVNFVDAVLRRDEAYAQARRLIWQGHIILNQDVMPLASVADRDAHHLIYAPLGGKYQIGVPLWHQGEEVTFVNVLRADSPFSERDRTLVRLLRDHILQSRPASQPALHALSRRQAEVLRWLAEGKRDSEIALILGTSTRTVNHQVSAILQTLGVETRLAATLLARGGMAC